MAYDREKARWARIFRVYGITKEQYDKIDKGKCPICLRRWSQKVRPCVEHDHKTLEIRGLACVYCNRYVIGRHRDYLLFARASRYLKGPYTGYFVPKNKKKKRKKK